MLGKDETEEENDGEVGVMARTGLNKVKTLIMDAKKSLSPERQFLADLKFSVEKSENAGGRKPSNLYKPSSMNCVRQMYYVRTGAERDANGASFTMWGICNSGSDAHERIQRAVAEMRGNGLDCDYADVAKFVSERNLDDLEIVRQEGMETHLHHKTLFLSFLCDGIVKYRGKYYILEIKTESGHKWYGREGVDQKHFTQATAYCVSLGIPDVIFLYVNRDVFDAKVYLFTPTDEMKADFVGKVENCEQHVRDGMAPPVPDGLPRNVCEYCQYKTQCRGDF